MASHFTWTTISYVFIGYGCLFGLLIVVDMLPGVDQPDSVAAWKSKAVTYFVQAVACALFTVGVLYVL